QGVVARPRLSRGGEGMRRARRPAGARGCARPLRRRAARGAALARCRRRDFAARAGLLAPPGAGTERRLAAERHRLRALPQARPERRPSRRAAAKGLTETIEALALARSEGVAARLVIAGSGPEEAGLRATVRDLGLEDEVRFAGP